MLSPRVQLGTGLLVASLLLSGCGGDGSRTTAVGSPVSAGLGASGSAGSASAGSTGTAGTSAASTKPGKSASPAGRTSTGPGLETAPPKVALHTLRPVRIGAARAASLDSGAQVSVTGVQEITVQAAGPGEVAGKAIAASVRVRNASKAAIDLGGFVATASVAGDQPASPSDAKPAAPLSGELPAGDTAVGVYVFTVPGSDFRGLEIQVSSDTAADIAVFRR